MLLNKIKLILLLMFFSTSLLAGLDLKLVGPGFVKFDIILPSNTKDNTFSGKLYRDDVLIKTVSSRASSDNFILIEYKNSNLQKQKYIYKLVIMKKDTTSGDEVEDEKQIIEVDASILDGMIEESIYISGEWDIGTLDVSSKLAPVVVTIDNAILHKAKDERGALTIYADVNFEDTTVNISNTTLDTLSLIGYRENSNFSFIGNTFENSILDIYNATITTFDKNRGNITNFNANLSGSFSENELTFESISITILGDSVWEKNNFKGQSNLVVTFLEDLYYGLTIQNNNFDQVTLSINQKNSIQNSSSSGNIAIKNNNLYTVSIEYYDNITIEDNNISGGVYTAYSDGGTIKQNMIDCKEGSTSEGITLRKVSNFNVYKNSIVPFCYDGIFVGYSSNVILNENNISVGNGYKALYIDDVNDSTISNNRIMCGNATSWDIGITASSLVNSTLSKNIIYGEKCSYSFKFIGNDELPFSKNIINGNIFESAGKSAEISGCLKDNLFYNNAIIGNDRYDLSIGNSIECNGTRAENQWNSEKKSGPNIVNGAMIGGNYWQTRSYMSSDKDGDGFLDSPISIYLHANSNTYIYDNLALSADSYSVVSGASNPTKIAWNNATGTMRVLHLKLLNGFISKGDLKVEKLAFTFTGSSSVSTDDIESITLYDDATCSIYVEPIMVATKTFTDDNVSFDIDILMEKNTQHCYYLEYKLKESVVQARFNPQNAEYCPCSLYGAKISGKDIVASVNSAAVRLNGLVEGSVDTGWAEIVHISDGAFHRLVQKNEQLKTPLQAKLVDVISACNKEWKALFRITKTPDGSNGANLIYNGIKAQSFEVEFDKSGIASIDFIGGDKQGSYIVEVVSEPSINTCATPSYKPTIIFEIFIGGIKLKAELDASDGGDDDTSIATFITTIDAKNMFTAEADLPSWAGEAKEIKFVPSWTVSVSDTTSPFQAEFNMAKLNENSTLTVTAITQDAQEFSEVYTFNSIIFPTWIGTFNGMPYDGITWEFKEQSKNYEFAFSFPGDFIWKNPIPDSIALIGGEENEQGLKVNATASYGIDRSSALSGSGAFSGQLFGKEIEVKGNMKAYFDEQFETKASPPPIASFSAKIDFDLGSKTLASKTILVYGVPVTVAVDIGGNVQVFAEGKLIFSKKLEIDKAIFIPGSTITITIDASASAAFGLAKIGIKAEPQGTVKIKLLYTTKQAKVTQEQFGGEFEVPVTIYGSLFWGTVSGDLGSTEFGPWKFGDSVSMRSLRLRNVRVVADKKFYSTSATTSNVNGDTIRIYTTDTSASATSINPEIAYSITNSSGVITSNNLWEIDPHVTFLNANNALAIWTSNDGDKALNKLNEILNHQDIAVSIYNGSSWNTPILLIDDTFADGSAKVAYDASSSKAMAIWVHNSLDTVEAIESKKGFELYFAIYDVTTKTWSSALSLNATKDTSADFMPSITSLQDGHFMAVWVRDIDGKLFSKLAIMKGGSDIDKSNSDSNIVYAIYDPILNTWSSVNSITNSNNQTELMPAVSSSDKYTVSVWIEKGLNNLQNLYMSQFSSNSWSLPKLLDSASYVMEDPTIIIKDNSAHIIYRRMDGSDEGLYEIVETLGVSTSSRAFSRALTKPKKLADGTFMWNSASLDNAGTIQLSWTNPNKTDTLARASINAIPNAELNTTTVTPSEMLNSKFKYLQLTNEVIVIKDGEYALSATLLSPSGTTIESITSSKKLLTSGNTLLSLNFNGTKINAINESGHYVIKDIKLMQYTPDSVIIATIDSFTTVILDASIFTLVPLQLDADSYSEGDFMTIHVMESNITNGVSVVLSSSSGGEVTLALDAKDQNYSKVVDLQSTGLILENGSVIEVEYVDVNRDIWRANAIWVDKIQPDYILNIPSGWSMLSPPVTATTDIATIFNKVDVVWAYSGGVWSAWSPDTSIRTSLSNDGFTILSTVEASKGYYVRSQDAHSVEMFSSEWGLGNLTIQSGWNLVGFSSDISVDEVFTLHPKVDRVWCLENSSWKGLSSSAAVNSSMLDKGHGILTSITKAQACFVHSK